MGSYESSFFVCHGGEQVRLLWDASAGPAGIVFAGWFAVKLCPDYLRHIRKAETVICVTGTDGKTTTANLLSDLLAATGRTVANNRIGSNTEFGIATAMTCSVTLSNRCRVDAVVLEVDEKKKRISLSMKQAR
mgnify:CR=1 FL=1